MSASVVIYVADGCHLCEAALDVVAAVRRETPFELRVVDITGDPGLEAAHRTSIPVVEIDGDLAFRYHVHPGPLRERVRRGG